MKEIQGHDCTEFNGNISTTQTYRLQLIECKWQSCNGYLLRVVLYIHFHHHNFAMANRNGPIHHCQSN